MREVGSQPSLGAAPHLTLLPEGERTSSERLHREMVREHAG
jgi:hypothetical protein